MSTNDTLVLLSVLLAVVVVAVLAVALIEVRRRLHSISEGLATLGGGCDAPCNRSGRAASAHGERLKRTLTFRLHAPRPGYEK